MKKKKSTNGNLFQHQNFLHHPFAEVVAPILQVVAFVSTVVKHLFYYDHWEAWRYIQRECSTELRHIMAQKHSIVNMGFMTLTFFVT